MSLNNTSEDMTENSDVKGGDNVSPKTSTVQTMQARKISRRSTIFRKDATSSDVPGSDDLPTSSPLIYHQDSDFKSSDSASNHNTQDHQDEPRISLSDYEKALQTETEEWSRERRSRSDKFRLLHTQLKSRTFDLITLESCADLLSVEDKKFISERPSYVQIANSVRDLKEDVMIAMGLKKSVLLQAKTMSVEYLKKLEVIDWEVANFD